MGNLKHETGSIELIVLGLLAALIVVLAIPAFQQIGADTHSELHQLSSEVTADQSE